MIRGCKAKVGTGSQKLLLQILALILLLSGEVGYRTMEAIDGGPSTNEYHLELSGFSVRHLRMVQRVDDKDEN